MATALVQCIQCEETVTYRLKHFLCSLTMHRSVPGPSFRVPHNRVGGGAAMAILEQVQEMLSLQAMDKQ